MKIYLAAVEGGGCKPVRDKIESALYSFYYIKRSKQCIKDAKKLHRSVFIDSGAHSFFAETEGIGSANHKIKKSKTKGTPQEYFEIYLSWLVENYEYYDYYAELDIGELVGQQTVNDWREQLKIKGVFDKCITVFHPTCMDWNDYTRMLDDSESGFIALEGDRNSIRKRLNYNKYLKPANERQIKVHGFAMTKQDVLNSFPFYSVDSASWLQAQMYGTLPCFINGKLTALRWADKKHYLRYHKMNLDRLRSDDKQAQRIYTMELSILAYKEMEEYYTNLWTKRGIIWNE